VRPSSRGHQFHRAARWLPGRRQTTGEPNTHRVCAKQKFHTTKRLIGLLRVIGTRVRTRVRGVAWCRKISGAAKLAGTNTRRLEPCALLHRSTHCRLSHRVTWSSWLVRVAQGSDASRLRCTARQRANATGPRGARGSVLGPERTSSVTPPASRGVGRERQRLDNNGAELVRVVCAPARAMCALQGPGASGEGARGGGGSVLRRLLPRRKRLPNPAKKFTTL
jgi:hypothetical protein